MKELTAGVFGLVGIVVGVFLLLFIFTSFRTVGVGQVGIVTKFGKVVAEDQSGLHVIWPWPIEHMSKMNIQNQKVQIDATAATHDLQDVTSTVALNFNLTPSSVNTVYRTIGVNYVSTVVDPILQETVKAVTSQYDATDLVQKRPEVEAKTLAKLTTALNNKGVTVDNFSIVNFSFSQQFSDAIEKKQISQQEALQAQYDLQTAQLKAQQQQAQGATLTPEYLQLKAIERWNGVAPIYVGGSSNIFSIPLQGNNGK